MISLFYGKSLKIYKFAFFPLLLLELTIKNKQLVGNSINLAVLATARHNKSDYFRNWTLTFKQKQTNKKLYILKSQHKMILQKSHNSKSAVHFGFLKILHLVKHHLWEKNIEICMTRYPICSSTKRHPGTASVLLQPVAKPQASWKGMFMDFIVELPESSGNMVIWVVTDLFSKQVHFTPCSKIPLVCTLYKHDICMALTK